MVLLGLDGLEAQLPSKSHTDQGCTGRCVLGSGVGVGSLAWAASPEWAGLRNLLRVIFTTGHLDHSWPLWRYPLGNVNVGAQ